MKNYTSLFNSITENRSVKFYSLLFDSSIFLFALFILSSSVNAQLTRTAASTTAAGITPTRDDFRTDLGGGTVAGANGSFGGVRREINWDGVPDGFSAPNNLPANFFNVNSPRGVVFSTPGTGFQVSANSSAPPVEFGNIDPSYPSLFAPFSAQKLFTALGNTITEVNFFVPGTATPALTKGFGVVFSDVNLLNVTSIELFDKNNVSLGKTYAPALTGNETFSFVSVSYPVPTIARVRITSGNTVLGAGHVESVQVPDLVVMDDFLYGEPVAIVCTPPTFLNDASIVLDASQCGNDGNISIIPQSGTAPFMYSIDGGTTYVSGANSGHTFQNVAAGTYQLRLKDANGCESAVVTREVKTVYPCASCTPPTFLNDKTIVLDASCSGGDGNITIVPLTGTAPFMYSINGGTTYVSGANSGHTFQNLAAGMYQLRLKDANGCQSAVVTREVKANAYGPCAVLSALNPRMQPAALDAAQVMAYPNPSHGQFRVQLSRFGSSKVQVQILDARGSVVQTKTINPQENNQLDISLQGKAKGLYFVRVISDKGTQIQKVQVQ